MGRLIEGEWKTKAAFADDDGVFRRQAVTFRDEVAPEDVASGRFRLYVSFACPWAHRCLIVRARRGLAEHIPISVVHWFMGDEGWTFEDGPGVVPDPDGAAYLREVYLRADPKFTGRVTVPILWDTKTGRIVNNESREIVRQLDTVFEPLASAPTLAPKVHREAIDQTITAIYEPVNNGVYKSGFARTQEAYEKAVTELFDALDHWEQVLSKRRFLVGDALSEADVCLFTTLIRFDPVYHHHFKCTKRRIRDYPNLWGFLRDVYQHEGVRETVDLHHIRHHYFGSHESVNPTRIVPLAPDWDLDAPHGRD